MIVGQQACFKAFNAMRSSRQHICLGVRFFERYRSRVAYPQAANAPSWGHGSHSCHSRASVSCRADQNDIGGYTPADYITYSNDPSKQCHHHQEVLVDAPIDLCFAWWHDWSKLIEFLDLIGQVGLDPNTPDCALFQCFYRWRKLPLMEILFLLERTRVEINKSIHFASVYGMPMQGQVQLQETADGLTRVKLYFTHPTPTLLVQLQIGPFGLETHLGQILQENMQVYKAKLQAQVPADWQQQKQQIAASVQQQDRQQLLQSQPPRQQLPQSQQQQQQQQQQLQQLEPQPMESTSSSQAAGAAPPAGRKQRTSRQTASVGAAERNEASAPAAAPPPAKPRSRPATSRKTTSAAPADAGQRSNTSSAGRRRTRAATATGVAAGSNGNNWPEQQPQQQSSTKAPRRPSRRTTVSARE